MQELINMIITTFNTLQNDADYNSGAVDVVCEDLRSKVNKKHESGRYKYGKQKRDFALTLIRECLYNLRMNHVAGASIYKGEIYINHKTTPKGLKNLDDLCGTGLSREDWHSMDRCDVWVKTGKIYKK